MILIGIGSNVDGPWGSPRETVERAIAALGEPPLRLVNVSRLLVTAPFGRADQPNFVNAVAEVETALEPQPLLHHLHELELRADRRRTLRWGPRTLDLDLLDYHGLVLPGEDGQPGRGRRLVLPHPGIAERPFVLKPIAEIAPDWRHPVLGETAEALLARLGEHPQGDEVGGN